MLKLTSPTASDVSNFMSFVLLRGFASGIASNLGAVLNQPHLSSRAEGSTTIANALTAVMRAALSVCAQGRIVDEEGLGQVLAEVRKQFEVTKECDEADERVARGCLEHVYQLVEQNARASFQEAIGGFPVSNGDFAVWEEARLAASHSQWTAAT